jgi:hypothetical protein
MAKHTKTVIDSGEVLACLRKHLMAQRPVTLHNTYQGVPVRTEAEVAMVSEAALGLIVHPYQAVCIKFERRTFIESKSLPKLIRAYPTSIDYTNQVVMLKKLKIPQSINIDLFNSWVAPDEPVAVAIQARDGDPYTTEMLGIAVLKDNRVRVVMAVPEDAPYARGDKLALGFQLEQGADTIWVQGKAHSLAKIRNQGARRLEVDGRAVMADEISILAYIAKREDQIMTALDKTFKKLRKGKITGRR